MGISPKAHGHKLCYAAQVTGKIKGQEYSPHTSGLSPVDFSSDRLHGCQSVLGVSVALTLDERVFEVVGAHGLSGGQLRLQF